MESGELVKTTALCAAVAVIALRAGVAPAAEKSAAIDLITRVRQDEPAATGPHKGGDRSLL